MDFPSTIAPAADRRVRRSRSALMRAAIALVAERGTTAVPLSDIATAADVSRQVVYQQFGDRDTLLLEAGLDLARRELLPGVEDSPEVDGHARMLAMVRHFAEHRAFYRAMFTGPCCFALNKALSGLMVPFNRQAVEIVHGGRLDARTAQDVASFLTGGWSALVNTWVVEAADPLEPEAFAGRLMRMIPAIVPAFAPKE